MRLPALMALREAAEAGTIFVSPFSAWEIAMLAARGRLRLSRAPEPFFQGLVEQRGTSLAPLTPAILIAAHFLPPGLNKDPADRIIAATAREYGCAIVTRDRDLLAYAGEGHVNAIEC
jgi:PIN domain nuclease of toxin-antitoxin system